VSHWTSDDKYIDHPSAPTGSLGRQLSLADGCFEEVSVSQPHWTIGLEGNLLNVNVVRAGDPFLVADTIRDPDVCSNSPSRDGKLFRKEGRGRHLAERVNQPTRLYHLLSLS